MAFRDWGRGVMVGAKAGQRASEPWLPCGEAHGNKPATRSAREDVLGLSVEVTRLPKPPIGRTLSKAICLLETGEHD